MRISEQEREFHRKVAAQCFNKAWDLLDKKRRSDEDNLQMLYLSHASRYHWGLIGAPRNRAVGEWQLSRIYAALGQPQMALWFARSCLATCRNNDLSDIIHTAYEAMARASAVSKDYRRARRYLDKARRRLDESDLEKSDRGIYLDQIAETEGLIRR
jgi:tetratricopeptide (TPR) repeat protein